MHFGNSAGNFGVSVFRRPFGHDSATRLSTLVALIPNSSRLSIIGRKTGADPGVGAGARAHPWDEVSPLKMHYLIAFKRQSINGRPPLGEILYPPLEKVYKQMSL